MYTGCGQRKAIDRLTAHGMMDSAWLASLALRRGRMWLTVGRSMSRYRGCPLWRGARARTWLHASSYMHTIHIDNLHKNKCALFFIYTFTLHYPDIVHNKYVFILIFIILFMIIIIHIQYACVIKITCNLGSYFSI